MQSIFRLPWCSDQLGPKMSEDVVALDKMRTMPVVELPIFHTLKRKFSDTVEAVTPYPPSPVKKLRSDMEGGKPDGSKEWPPVAVDVTDFGSAASTAAAVHSATSSVRPSQASDVTLSDKTSLLGNKNKSVSSLPSLSDPATMDQLHDASYLPSSLSPLQQSIENQFNIQILMKHNELRLIEQELAKCQIALEQLRRCELRPYPGYDQPSSAVSEGRGSAVLPAPGFTRPSHPAPYGVTDGPYSHHYQQWLLRDELFDSVPVSSLSFTDSSAGAAVRSTRGVAPARKTVSKTSSMSTRHTEAASSMPNYPSAPIRDKSAPLILRRSTDGQLVKLICNNCHRGNFSSIQGFLNHCRIAHKVDYKSHDLAAIDCGQLLDAQEMASLPSTNQPSAPPPPKPSVSRSVSTNVTPARGNLVHPLNLTTTNPVMTKSSVHRASVQPVKDLNSARPHGTPEGPFKPSTQVPRLSQLFAKHNFGGDLEQAAALARQSLDIGHDDLPSSDSSSEQNSPIAFTAGPRPFTTPSHLSANTRPQSRKGHRQPAAARPRPAPLVSSDHQAHHDVDPLFAGPHSAAPSSATFSPNTVTDSNPGLVSDHEDDDHDASASEEEGTTPVQGAPTHHHHAHHHHHHHHHPMEPTTTGVRNCADHMEIDPVEDDDHHVVVHNHTDHAHPHHHHPHAHGVLIRRNSVFTAPGPTEARAAAGSPSRKVGSGKGGSGKGRSGGK